MGGTFTRKIRIMVGVICMVCMLMPSFTSYAYYDYNTDGKTIEEASKDPKYWNQGYVPDNDGLTLYNGRSISGNACSYFATSFALVKLGLMDPNKDNPVELIRWCNEDASKRVDIGGWHINPQAMSERYPGLEVVYPDYAVTDKQGDDVKVYVKGKMSEGYVVCLCIRHPDLQNPGEWSAHWICVDGFDGDKMIIADSAYYACNEPKDWEMVGGYGPHGNYTDYTASYAMLYKKEGVDPFKTPSIYGGEFTSNPMTDEEKERYQQILDDYDLVGMPDKSVLLDNSLDFELADNTVLSLEENNQLANIKENLNTGRLTVLGVFSVLCKVLGIILLIYAMLLIVGSITDKINMWVDVSIIKILTFGRNTLITSEDDQDADVKGMITIKQMAFRIVIVFLIGLLLLTPLPLKGYSLILKLFSKV